MEIGQGETVRCRNTGIKATEIKNVFETHCHPQPFLFSLILDIVRPPFPSYLRFCTCLSLAMGYTDCSKMLVGLSIRFVHLGTTLLMY